MPFPLYFPYLEIPCYNFLPGFRFIIQKLFNFNARINTPPTLSPAPPYAAEITISATTLAILTICLVHIAVTTQNLRMPSTLGQSI